MFLVAYKEHYLNLWTSAYLFWLSYFNLFGLPHKYQTYPSPRVFALSCFSTPRPSEVYFFTTFGTPLHYSSSFCFFHMSAQVPFLKEAGLLWPLLLKEFSHTPLHTIIRLLYFALFLFFLLITVCSLFLPITWTKAIKEKSYPLIQCYIPCV